MHFMHISETADSELEFLFLQPHNVLLLKTQGFMTISSSEGKSSFFILVQITGIHSSDKATGLHVVLSVSVFSLVLVLVEKKVISKCCANIHVVKSLS